MDSKSPVNGCDQMNRPLQSTKKPLTKTLVGIYLASLILSGISIAWATTGPYTSTIKHLQTTSIGSYYNTVFLTMDITDSPCSSTNSNDRFTITSNAQHSTILAALMGNKSITVTGTGACNAANIEILSSVVLKP